MFTASPTVSISRDKDKAFAFLERSCGGVVVVPV